MELAPAQDPEPRGPSPPRDPPPGGAVAPEAPPPCCLVTASDRFGLVGGFYSAEGAAAALAEWAGVPLLFQAWGAKGGSPALWALPYAENGAVAYATDRRELAAGAQAALLGVGLVPDDELDYWEAPIGAVVPAAARRRRLHFPAGGAAPGPAEIASAAKEAADLGREALRSAPTPPAGIGQFIVPTCAAMAAAPGTDADWGGEEGRAPGPEDGASGPSGGGAPGPEGAPGPAGGGEAPDLAAASREARSSEKSGAAALGEGDGLVD